MIPKGRTLTWNEKMARHFMKCAGFDKRVVKETVNEWVEAHGDTKWEIIEDDDYYLLHTKCVAKAKELEEEELTEEDEEEEEEKAIRVDEGPSNEGVIASDDSEEDDDETLELIPEAYEDFVRILRARECK